MYIHVLVSSYILKYLQLINISDIHYSCFYVTVKYLKSLSGKIGFIQERDCGITTFIMIDCDPQYYSDKSYM